MASISVYSFINDSVKLPVDRDNLITRASFKSTDEFLNYIRKNRDVELHLVTNSKYSSIKAINPAAKFYFHIDKHLKPIAQLEIYAIMSKLVRHAYNVYILTDPPVKLSLETIRQYNPVPLTYQMPNLCCKKDPKPMFHLDSNNPLDVLKLIKHNYTIRFERANLPVPKFYCEEIDTVNDYVILNYIMCKPNLRIIFSRNASEYNDSSVYSKMISSRVAVKHIMTLLSGIRGKPVANVHNYYISVVDEKNIAGRVATETFYETILVAKIVFHENSIKLLETRLDKSSLFIQFDKVNIIREDLNNNQLAETECTSLKHGFVSYALGLRKFTDIDYTSLGVTLDFSISDKMGIGVDTSDITIDGWWLDVQKDINNLAYGIDNSHASITDPRAYAYFMGIKIEMIEGHLYKRAMVNRPSRVAEVIYFNFMNNTKFPIYGTPTIYREYNNTYDVDPYINYKLKRDPSLKYVKYTGDFKSTILNVLRGRFYIDLSADFDKLFKEYTKPKLLTEVSADVNYAPELKVVGGGKYAITSILNDLYDDLELNRVKTNATMDMDQDEFIRAIVKPYIRPYSEDVRTFFFRIVHHLEAICEKLFKAHNIEIIEDLSSSSPILTQLMQLETQKILGGKWRPFFRSNWVYPGFCPRVPFDRLTILLKFPFDIFHSLTKTEPFKMPSINLNLPRFEKEPKTNTIEERIRANLDNITKYDQYLYDLSTVLTS